MRLWGRSARAGLERCTGLRIGQCPISLSAVSDARIDRRMMWRARCSGARSIQRLEGSRSVLRRTRVLWKFNRGNRGFDEASGMHDGGKPRIEREEELLQGEMGWGKEDLGG